MTPAEEHRRLGLALYGVGWHTLPQHGMRWDARVLNCYALHLVTRGSGWIEWGDRPRTRLPIKAPTAFWLFPGLVHSYRPDAGGWTITWALFDGPAAAGYESLDFLSRTWSPATPQAAAGSCEAAGSKIRILPPKAPPSTARPSASPSQPTRSSPSPPRRGAWSGSTDLWRSGENEIVVLALEPEDGSQGLEIEPRDRPDLGPLATPSTREDC